MVKSLPFSPRWGLRESSLIVGGYYSGDEHEQHFLQTVGSGNWYRSEYEEFRFRQDNHQLESVWFHVPEVNVEPEKQDVMSLWQFETPIRRRSSNIRVIIKLISTYSNISKSYLSAPNYC